MAVTIGQDALGNAIVTGDNNQTFVFYGVARMEDRRAPRHGSSRCTKRLGAVAGRPGIRGGARHLLAPVTPPGREARGRGAAECGAHRIGDGLALALSGEETAFLIAASRGDPPPPLLVVESDDDRILALPWELIRLHGQFAVRDGRLDVARSVPAETEPVLSKPATPMSLLVNISAPEGSGLDYERESYAIVRALHEHLGVVVNEMGEVDDLVDGLRDANPARVGAHFSGHGGPGTLIFEDEFGAANPVEIPKLLTKSAGAPPIACRASSSDVAMVATPPPSMGGKGLPAAATALHRDGITQVVGYFGPVLDELSTRAERAFYAELANGRRTRDAVRLARAEMSRVPAAIGRGLARDAGGTLAAEPLTYAWAEMVLYQRGPDYPLGTKIEADRSAALDTTQRRTERPYPNSRTRLLKAGFVGRRKEMHALRRDLRQGRHLHVVQGTGGLGRVPSAPKRVVVRQARLATHRLVVRRCRRRRRSGRRAAAPTRICRPPVVGRGLGRCPRGVWERCSPGRGFAPIERTSAVSAGGAR